MTKPLRISIWAFLTLLLCPPGVWAQKSDLPAEAALAQPTAPYAPLLSWASSTDTSMDSEQLTPDQHPQTGVQRLTLGQYSELHSFVLPSVSLTTQLDINTGGSNVSSLTYLLGNLDLHHVAGRSELLLNYTGGGMISTYGADANAVIQNLEFSDSFRGQRWSLLMADQVSYLSESSFGFGGVGGLGFLGSASQSGPSGVASGSLPSLDTVLIPSQTIPTAAVPRLSNTALAQVEYDLSPRSSWTAFGSYGLLRFFGAGFVSSSNALFQTGYNYQVSPQSSIGVLYRLNVFQFTNLGQGIDDQVVQLSYARRVTGRLSFQLAAGPDMEMIHGPLTGPSTQLLWSLDSSLGYALNRTALSLSYDHLVTGGSGVLVGAETNEVQGTVVRNFSQTWQGSVSMGYANNRSMLEAAVNTLQPLVSDWYGVVRVSDQLRPGMSFFVAYGARLQGTNTDVCSAMNCGTNSITHEISLGFNWGLRPIALR